MPLNDLIASSEDGYSIAQGETLQLSPNYSLRSSPTTALSVTSAVARRSAARRNAVRVLRDAAVPVNVANKYGPCVNRNEAVALSYLFWKLCVGDAW